MDDDDPYPTKLENVSTFSHFVMAGMAIEKLIQNVRIYTIIIDDQQACGNSIISGDHRQDYVL